MPFSLSTVPGKINALKILSGSNLYFTEFSLLGGVFDLSINSGRGENFAIAVDKSVQWGYDGVIFGFALNKELLNHYIGVFGCSHIGALHPYHFILGPIAAKKLLETYTYEWN